MSSLTLGFIPLTDCAPLVAAQVKGFFAGEGLDVTLSREASWATIRDKVTVGALDAAHMLAPMALAATAGAGGPVAPMIAPLALAVNGAGVTLSNRLSQALPAGAETLQEIAAVFAHPLPLGPLAVVLLSAPTGVSPTVRCPASPSARAVP